MPRRWTAWPRPNATTGPTRRPRPRVPELGDLAAARAWLDAELATLVAIAAYTASNGWPGHTTRLAATTRRYLDAHLTEGLTIYSHALNATRHPMTAPPRLAR